MSTSFVIFSSTPPPLLLHPDTADTNKIIIPTTCPQLRCLPLGGRPKCYCIVNIVSRSFTHFFVHKKEKCFEIETLVKKVKILYSLLFKVTKQQGNAVFMQINLDVEQWNADAEWCTALCHCACLFVSDEMQMLRRGHWLMLCKASQIMPDHRTINTKLIPIIRRAGGRAAR